MIELRDTVITYLQDNPVSGFNVTEELPWTQAEPLYIKNKKVLYVDQPQSVQEPLLVTFDETVIEEVYTVSVYVTTDAKTLPASFDEMYELVKNARMEASGYSQKVTAVSSEYDGDLLVTQFDVNYTRFIC